MLLPQGTGGRKEVEEVRAEVMENLDPELDEREVPRFCPMLKRKCMKG